jgi:hypothetical protein
MPGRKARPGANPSNTVAQQIGQQSSRGVEAKLGLLLDGGKSTSRTFPKRQIVVSLASSMIISIRPKIATNSMVDQSIFWMTHAAPQPAWNKGFWRGVES